MIETTGRWQQILPSFGVAGRFLVNKHGPCPICGGKDRYRFDDKGGEGTWICNRCGAGNGWTLLQKLYGWDNAETARRISEVLGGVADQMAPPKSAQQQQDEEERTRRACALNEVWGGCRPMLRGDEIYAYLVGRGLPTNSALKIHPALYESDEKKSFPAMVAQIISGDGKPVSLHRTFLKPNGKTRKIMPPLGTITGGAVRLCETRKTMGFAEGIETALAASQKFDLGVWACISSHGLESVVIPEECQQVVVLGDNDHTFTGQKAAYHLAWRAARDGKEVTVLIPDEEGKDWADCL